MFGVIETVRPRKVNEPSRTRFTYGTSGKLAASRTFSSGVWLLRNIAVAPSAPRKTSREIVPPIEGLSCSSRSDDDSVRVSEGMSEPKPQATEMFTGRQLRWG